jgi:putative ABC transport system permease protein
LVLTLPLFNTFIGRELSIGLSHKPWLVPVLLGFSLLIGVGAGLYPAFFLSSFRPVRVLKGGAESGRGKRRLRSVLVVFQYTISIMLIIGTISIYRQIHYMKNAKLGFNKEQVLVIPRMSEAMKKDYFAFREELVQLPGVSDAGASSRVPGRGNLIAPFFPEGLEGNQSMEMQYMDVDPYYLPAMGMEIISGRNFSPDIASDADTHVLINESTVKKIGWTEPLGKRFIFRPSPGSKREPISLSVLGVVKDFHLASLREKIEPLIVFYDLDSIDRMSLKMSTENISQTLGRLEKIWKRSLPDWTFSYYFLDDTFNAIYREEERAGSLIFVFCLLAVFVGCLGLLGMAAFSAERRTKEFGIRKVLGASFRQMLSLFVKEFVALVVLANVLAWPLAYYAVSHWLKDFAYRTNPTFGLFVVSGGAALIAALLAVGYQSVRIALSNPVENLRSE